MKIEPATARAIVPSALATPVMATRPPAMSATRAPTLAKALALVLLAATAAGTPAPGAAQETPADDLLTVGHYLDMERVGDPRISPDGRQVVYTRSWVDKMADRFESAVWIMDADGGRKRFLLEGSSPRWSPDGTRIAYIAPGQEGGPEGPQVFVRWMDAEGATTQVTREVEAPSNFIWSPDGAHVYFQRFVPESEPWPIDLPAAPEGANWTPTPRIVDRVHYRFDRIGFLEEGFTHLFRVPSDGGTARQLTSGSWNAGATFVSGVGNVGYDISPDGGTLIFDGLVEDADNRYRESHVYAMDLATGAIRRLTADKGPWGRPKISPDGSAIAYAGYPWTSQTYKTTDLYMMDADGGNQRLVSGSLDRDVGAVHWAANSSGVYFTAGDRGSMNVHFATPSGDVRQVTEGVHMLSLSSAARSGQAVGTWRRPTSPATW